MRAALELAARGLGNVWPNPAVGCVLVRDGAVVGRGWTQPGGRPHAETEALRRAGAAARGATAYVTLEPCSHHGRTPPCADALVDAGIARVVAAATDPDTRVDGRGLARLRAAGVAVEAGLLAEDAARLNAGFFHRVAEGRPLVTLKLASSLDGRIATAGGDSKWITGEVARARAHLLRARHDAVLAGIGTVLADDPELTCRLPGLEAPAKVRIVLDGGLRLPPGSRLARSARSAPVWCVGATAEGTAADRLRDLGVEVLQAPRGTDGRLDPAAVLRLLGGRGLTRVMVEGGGAVAGALLRAGLVDRIAWFRAPRVLGAEGRPAVGELGLARVADAQAWRRTGAWHLGADLLETYERPG